MTDAQLAELSMLARTLSTQTKSAKVRDACLVVIKAARARRSALKRTRRTPPASPYYNPLDTTITGERGHWSWTELYAPKPK